jgi:dihydrofolate reductase
MRKIIVYIATSADGYIARPDGDINWLNDQPPAEDYDMEAFFKTIDTILWGRKTWAPGANGFGPEVKNYVFTSKPPRSRPAGVEFVSEPVATFAKRLRSVPGKDIWLMGGSGIIASFLDAGEIDQFIIHVMPTFIGEGIPLIAPRQRSLLLDLQSVESYSNGMVRLKYDVRGKKAGKKPAAKRTSRKRPPARS